MSFSEETGFISGAMHKDVPVVTSELERQRGMLDKVRTFYLHHESDTSRKMVVVTKTILSQLVQNGQDATFLLGGSVGFGQASEETQDVDLVYVGESPSAFRQALATVVPFFNKEGIAIDHVDYTDIDVRLAKAFIDHAEGKPYEPWVLEYCNEEYVENQFERFVSLYWVNRALDNRYETLFQKALSLDHAVADQLRSTLSLNNAIPGVRKTDFANSFQKYKERLAKRNIEVPQEISALQEQLMH